MIKPQDIHPNAVAGLSVVTGSSSAGLLAELAKYEYVHHSDVGYPYYYSFPNDSSSALVFTDELTEVVILGRNPENIENLNFILSRAGWTSAMVHSVDQEAEELVLKAITLQVTDVQRQWKAEQTRNEMTASISSSVETANEATSELAVVLSQLETAQAQVASLEAERQDLQGLVSSLNNQISDLESRKGQGGDFSTLIENDLVRDVLAEKLIDECREHIQQSVHRQLYDAFKALGYDLHFTAT